MKSAAAALFLTGRRSANSEKEVHGGRSVPAPTGGGGVPGPRPCTIRQLIQAHERGDGILTISGWHCSAATLVGRVLDTRAVSSVQEKTGTTFASRHFTISDGTGQMTVRTPLHRVSDSSMAAAEWEDTTAFDGGVSRPGQFMFISGSFSFDPVHRVVLVGTPRPLEELDELVFHMLLALETHLRVASKSSKTISARRPADSDAAALGAAHNDDDKPAATAPASVFARLGVALGEKVTSPFEEGGSAATVEESLRALLAAHPQSTLSFVLEHCQSAAGGGQRDASSIRRELRRLVAAGDVAAKAGSGGLTAVVYSLQPSQRPFG